MKLNFNELERFVSLELSEGIAKYHITQDEAKEILALHAGNQRLMNLNQKVMAQLLASVMSLE